MKQLTKEQYCVLKGLMLLARDHNRELESIARAAREITGEDDPNGHTSDMVYGARDFDDGLILLKLERPSVE